MDNRQHCEEAAMMLYMERHRNTTERNTDIYAIEKIPRRINSFTAV